MALDVQKARQANGEAGVELVQSPFGAAPTGYGQYDQLFAANPYRQQTYNKSFWQDVAGVLGFRTGYDDWLDQTSTQIAEYDAGIFSQMQQDQMNSPAAMAQRERQAGINPDLAGIGDVAPAAGPTEDVNGMQPSQDDTFSKIGSLVGGFGRALMSSFDLGLKIFNGIASVRKINADINALAIGNADRIVDVVDKIIVGSVPISAFSSDSGDKLDQYASVIDMSKYGFTGAGLTAANEAFKDRFDSIKNNASVREQVYKRFGAMSDTFETASKGFIPDAQMPASPDDIFNLEIESMARASRRILELGQTNKEFEERVLTPAEQANEQIQNEIANSELADLQEADFGSDVASAKIASTRSSSYFDSAQQIINEEKAALYGRLKALSDSGSSFATSMLHAMALQDMLQFDFSAGLDLSFLKGLSSLAGSLTSNVFGKNPSRKFDDEFSNGLRKTFGSGLNFNVHLKSK